jgi:hypothetical protein
MAYSWGGDIHDSYIDHDVGTCNNGNGNIAPQINLKAEEKSSVFFFFATQTTLIIE